MRNLFFYFITLPLAITLVIFAIANRHVITVSLDVFSPQDPAYSFNAPLFMVIFIALIIGVIIGGFFTWIGQNHYRRKARKNQQHTDQQHTEMKY